MLILSQAAQGLPVGSTLKKMANAHQGNSATSSRQITYRSAFSNPSQPEQQEFSLVSPPSPAGKKCCSMSLKHMSAWHRNLIQVTSCNTIAINAIQVAIQRLILSWGVPNQMVLFIPSSQLQIPSASRISF